MYNSVQQQYDQTASPNIIYTHYTDCLLLNNKRQFILQLSNYLKLVNFNTIKQSPLTSPQINNTSVTIEK